MKKIILIFFITIITNYSFAKDLLKKAQEENDDLSGNAIDCYTEDDEKIRYYITIKFISDKKSIFAFAVYDSTKNKIKKFLNSTEVDYLTFKNHIAIISSYQERFYQDQIYPYFGFKVEDLYIDRRDLSTSYFKIIRGGFFADMEGCKIADYDNPNLFEIYNKLEEIVNYPEPPQEEKKLL